MLDRHVAEIKKQAIQFAIKERFFYTEPNTTNQTSKYCAVPSSNSQDTQPVAPGSPLQSVCAPDKSNLDEFANYAYNYHFLWPKTSRLKEISYPTVGLTTYLDLMSNGVAANMAVGATNAAKTFGGLNVKYLQDYAKTLQLYKDNLDPNNQTSAAKLKLLNAEIDKTQTDLANQISFNALANNTSLDSQLLNATAGVNTSSKIGGNATLSGDQAKFLNAVGALRIARKAQLKKLDTFKKAIAKNGNPDRAIKIASASKSFSAKFASPLSGSKSGAGLFGSGGLDGAGLNSADDKNKSNAGGNAFGSGIPGYGSAAVGANHSGLGRSGSGDGADGSASAGAAGSGSGTCSKPEFTTAATCQANGGTWTPGDGMSDEDRKRIASKEMYASKENDTLFQKITNAYIRNYDKILTRKKDKDIIEKK